MEDKLAILETTIPLRSIPDVQDVLEDVLCSVINDLLSLKGDSAKKLYQAVPAIKKHCWSMGFEEVVKMFTMYADGELSIQPRSNYFDRVLVGQIFNAYKKQKVIKKPYQHYTSPEEIEFIMAEAVDRIQKDYQQNGCITEMCHHVYDHLFELGKLPKHTKQYKEEIQIRAIKIYESKPIEDQGMMQEIIDNFDEETINIIKNIKKRLVLEDYFKPIQNTNK